MKIGIAAAFGDSPYRDPGYLRDFAILAEETGFNSLWFPEHVVFFPEYRSAYPYKESGKVPWGQRTGLYDPLLACTVAAGVTKTLRFGTTVLVVPERPPLLLAKEIMTLDHICAGRFEFGAGLGWSSEEYAALGVPWEDRGKRFDEYLDVIKLVWSEQPADFHGQFVDFKDVILQPFPVTPGGPPMLIGGNSKPAMRRSVRLGDGWYGVWMGFDDLEPVIMQLHGFLEAGGRQPDDGFAIKLNLPLSPDLTEDELNRKVASARDLGIHEFVIQFPIRSKTLVKDMEYWADATGVVAEAETK